MSFSNKEIKLTPASEESINVLQNLRKAKAKDEERKTMIDEIQQQLATLRKLEDEKERLSSQLEDLKDGGTLPEEEDDPATYEARTHLQDLKEKLMVHRIIGPSGLTVLNMDENDLVVSFTCFWQGTTVVFVLSITSYRGAFKVKGTNIPYFIEVQSMVEKLDSKENMGKLLDDIGHKLTAYVTRKGELETVKDNHEDSLKTCNTNDAVASIELRLHGGSNSADTGELTCWLDYPTVDAARPSQVDVSHDSVRLSSSKVTKLCSWFKDLPLSEAVPKVLSFIKGSQSGDTDELGDSSQ